MKAADKIRTFGRKMDCMPRARYFAKTPSETEQVCILPEQHVMETDIGSALGQALSGLDSSRIGYL